MAVYENGKMDVLIDGELRQREYSVNVGATDSNRYIDRVQARFSPHTNEGEEVVWIAGSDVPYILQRPVNHYKDESYDRPHPNFEEW